jgi:hypothetical protein
LPNEWQCHSPNPLHKQKAQPLSLQHCLQQVSCHPNGAVNQEHAASSNPDGGTAACPPSSHCTRHACNRRSCQGAAGMPGGGAGCTFAGSHTAQRVEGQHPDRQQDHGPHAEMLLHTFLPSNGASAAASTAACALVLSAAYPLPDGRSPLKKRSLLPCRTQGRAVLWLLP